MSYAEHDVQLENGLSIVIASKGDEVVITANGRMAVLGFCSAWFATAGHRRTTVRYIQRS